MSNYHIGQYIKKRREELNVNQDALCYGICNRSTLSRIERGRQEPSYQVLKALLQRLGISENRCQILIGPQEFAIVELQREIVADNVKHDFSAALQKIERLEALLQPEQQPILQQFVLRVRALAGYECDGKRCPYDYPTQRQMLMQALDMTHPNFDLEKIERCLLSIEDMKSLNQIAITYSETGDRRFAIRIYEQLMKYPRNRLFNNEALLTVTPMLCYNFSRLLGRERRYEECIEIAQYGYDISLKYDKARVLGGLLLNIGYSLEKLGRKEESMKYLKASYYAYCLIGWEKEAQNVKNYIKEIFGIEQESLF